MAEPVANGSLPTDGQDVEMKEETSTPAASALHAVPDQPTTTTATDAMLAPAAAATPPAPSASATRPGSMPPQPVAKPDKPVAHGGPTRQYLNQNVTPHLLEAMKHLAAYEPEKPLLWLSEFLKDRSREVEGGGS
ncbi:uncharacterized protein LTR77_003651 [Saxophila tyrrhenica]|uniref:Uncharacterized protein n=1 Tax=Saxophila tyrrhenica TaxID=1690608 RepID=A0AAV9PIK1_9PEZI|nr:hypothetical protein LTR77_003651 [Saxophila tyrrhenica]